MPVDPATDSLVVRRAGLDDLAGILELAHRSLGWTGRDEDARYFHWKHFESSFGASPMWVALDGHRIIGFRAFLRWQLRTPSGSTLSAVRAVDTATHPEYQGRGIFTRLTLGALDELRAEGVDLIFNTPNRQSLPGYLKMGWSIVGRLPTAIRVTHLRSVATLTTARRPASRRSIEASVGESARDVLEDRAAVAQLLARRPHAQKLATIRSPEFLSWRYSFEPLHYRALLGGSAPADGFVVFRLRRRGSAVEAVICDVLTPGTEHSIPRALIREVARRTGADYLIRLQRSIVSAGPFVRVPRTGPILTCRRLDPHPVPRLRDWDLAMGDIELF